MLTTSTNTNVMAHAISRRNAGLNSTWRTIATIAPLVAIDAFGISASMLLSQFVLSFAYPAVDYAVYRQLAPLLVLSFLVFPICRVYFICGLHPSKELRRMSIGVVVVFVLLLAANVLIGKTISRYEITLVVTTLAASFFIHLPLRFLARAVLSSFSWWGWPVVVTGDQAHGNAIIAHLKKTPILGMQPIANFNVSVKNPQGRNSEDFARIMATHRTNHVIYAMGDSGEQSAEIELWSTVAENLTVAPLLPGIPTLWTVTHDFGGKLGLHATPNLLSASRLACKRALDVLIILLALPLVIPLCLAIAALIKCFSKGPVFFGHERIGRNGKSFKAWKFRSMVVNADETLKQFLAANPSSREEWERDQKLKHDPRTIPHIGKLIRALSLDELPQLWNVIRGEMSLVGPRPIVEAEIPKYRNLFPLYLRVTPGLTGLWQVSGRNNTTYEERINFDAYYVRNWSPWLDLYIIARTAKTVLMREGAY